MSETCSPLIVPLEDREVVLSLPPDFLSRLLYDFKDGGRQWLYSKNRYLGERPIDVIRRGAAYRAIQALDAFDSGVSI